MTVKKVQGPKGFCHAMNHERKEKRSRASGDVTLYNYRLITRHVTPVIFLILLLEQCMLEGSIQCFRHRHLAFSRDEIELTLSQKTWVFGKKKNQKVNRHIFTIILGTQTRWLNNFWQTTTVDHFGFVSLENPSPPWSSTGCSHVPKSSFPSHFNTATLWSLHLPIFFLLLRFSWFSSNVQFSDNWALFGQKHLIKIPRYFNTYPQWASPTERFTKSLLIFLGQMTMFWFHWDSFLIFFMPFNSLNLARSILFIYFLYTYYKILFNAQQKPCIYM